MEHLSIKQKSKDQATNNAIRIFASICIALSGLILYSDKVFSFQLENNFGFKSTQTFIWVLSQSVSPLLLILGSVFKPFKVSYTIPLYLYAIQTIWIFNANLRFDDVLMQTYAVGTVIGFVLLTIAINTVLNRTKTINESKITLLEKALDLSISLKKTATNE